MLNKRESDVVGDALRASVEGPFFPDWEFHTLMGVDREEMRAVLAAWPDIRDAEIAALAIHSALVNLLGYPHNQWKAWRTFSDADEQELNRVFHRWRSASDNGTPQGFSGTLG
jgi:hypothetical protein